MNTIKPIILIALLCLGIVDAYGQDNPVPKPAKNAAFPKVDSLKTAIVIAPLRPHIKGDTIEYNTDNIHMPPNAVVEELLRRLPGLRIDLDGTIFYNGEKIQHLLVDGEDIFGSDPTMVTRNFDASKIAKVQVLDHKNDQALFTGIDDGARTKTVNLVLKESAKDGYFGKVETGGNMESNYNANGALAAFQNKEQFTALGIASNTGILQLNNNSSGASVTFLNSNTDPLGASAGTGIPRFNAIALHYANSWNGLDNHTFANYQFSHYYTQPITNTQTIQAEPDNIYQQAQQNQSVNRQNQHWIYGIYEWAPNKISAFKFTYHSTISQAQNQLSSETTSTFNDTLVNNSQRTIKDNVNRQVIGGIIAYRLLLGKQAGRIISVTTSVNKINTSTNGYLYSVARYYQANNTLQSSDTTDQRKQIGNNSLQFDGSINFAQPVWRGTTLGLSYGISQLSGDPIQDTYDRGNGKYAALIDSLSSNYKAQTTVQHATINLEGKVGHLNYTAGNDIIKYNYKQHDLIEDFTFQLNYVNLAPRLLFNYLFDQTTNLKLSYNTSTQQPSLNQLAPIVNNNDPLHITTGNPNLKPSLVQNFQLDFHKFKVWMMNLTINMSVTSNSISTKTFTDSLGRQISQPVNVDGGKTAGFNFSLYKKLMGFNWGFNSMGTYARTLNYVNTDLSKNDIYSEGGGVIVNKFATDKYSLELNVNFSHFDQISSVNTSAPVHYWVQNHRAALTIYLIKGFELNTNMSYTWQQKTNAFTSSTSILLCNTYISRNFLRNKLVAKFQFNNILNANSGISRTNIGNINTQNSSNILGRYWMLSVIFHFDRNFKKQ